MDAALIIDDDPIAIEIARALLTKTGTTNILSASDVSTAKTILAENGPLDLLLMDLNMPDCDGVELLDHLRAIDFFGAIIIVSAAHATVRNGATQLGKAYGLKVVGVLEKPLTLQKFVPALAHA